MTVSIVARSVASKASCHLFFLFLIFIKTFLILFFYINIIFNSISEHITRFTIF